MQQPNNARAFGPKVKKNIENGVPFELVFYPGAPSTIFLKWPDQSRLMFEFSAQEMHRIVAWAKDWEKRHT